MDILCIRCGEPWDVLGISDEFTLTQKRHFYEGKGCPSCGTTSQGALEESEMYRSTTFAREVQIAFKEVLGDDVDGLAAMMEDFGLV